MKTPREILSQRHASAELKLDAIRKAVVAEHVIAPQFEEERRNRMTFSFSTVTAKLWVELILPCRRFWLATAAVWLVIVALNLPAGDAPQMAANKTSPPGPETLMALIAQRQLMTQLLDSSVPPPAARPGKPAPRSEQRKATPIA